MMTAYPAFTKSLQQYHSLPHASAILLHLLQKGSKAGRVHCESTAELLKILHMLSLALIKLRQGTALSQGMP